MQGMQGEVFGAGVADGHGGVLLAGGEEESEGFADYVGAAYDYYVAALGGDAGLTEEHQDSVGGAGEEGLFAQEQFAKVYGVEAVDVFSGVYGVDYRLLTDVLGQGELEEYPVDHIIII